MLSPDQLKVCVIGAGPSGITAAKNLRQVGITNLVVYEKSHQVGGNWAFSLQQSHSSVFETTHIISSKTLSQYLDFPFPQEYPDYPSHKQLLEYFQSYAREFDLLRFIRFQTEVTAVRPAPNHRWQVTVNDGTTDTFDAVLVSNGHHWNPRMPTYPGTFTGQLLHSHDFKTNQPFRDQRVLVIGGGNSACDIAVETSRISQRTVLSMRRGYYFIPKFMFGLPSDVVNAKLQFLPKSLRTHLLKIGLDFSIGKPELYGLQKPDHQLLQTHPVVNSELLYFIRHGKIHPRPDIARFEGQNVVFVDGQSEEIDVIIAATGFHITFPFFEPGFVDFDGTEVPLYLKVFHADHPTLFFIGLIQPMGCIWPLADLQSKLVANTLIGNWHPPANIRELIEWEVKHPAYDFVKTPRHSVEVDYHLYSKALLRHIPKDAPDWKDQFQNGQPVGTHLR